MVNGVHDLVEREGAEGLAVLLAPGVRWGWQCADPSRAVLPFPAPEPAYRGPVLPDYAAIAAAATPRDPGGARRKVTAIMWLGAFPFGVVADAVLMTIGIVPSSPNSTAAGLVGVLLIVAWILFWRSRRSRIGASQEPQKAVARAQATFEQQQAAAIAVHQSEVQGWRAAAREFAERQAAEIARLPRWGGAVLRTEPRRVDVFGDAGGWPGLLTTLGCSLLASGPVILLDFSARAAGEPLYAVSRFASGRTRQLYLLPDQVSSCDLFAGLTQADIRDVLVEAFHSDIEGASREQRALADRVFDEIFRVLGDDLSMARIWRAVRAVAGQEAAPRPGGELSIEEWDQLSQTFGEDYRVRVGERLFIMENQLYALREMGSASGKGPSGTVSAPDRKLAAPGGPDTADLTCFVVKDTATSVTAEMLSNLLVQWTARAVGRRSRDRGLTVVLAGADDLNERMLGRLDAATDAAGARLVVLFRDLKEERLERMGSGGAVGFFRLTAETQARRAADWIGREHKFVVSQLTMARGTSSGWSSSSSTSDSSSVSWSDMDGDAYLGLTPTVGGSGLSITRGSSESTGSTGGTNEQYSQGEQRVEEHVVSPDALRRLADGCLLLVEFGDRAGGRRVLAADVSPRLAWEPQAVPEPLPAALVRDPA